MMRQPLVAAIFWAVLIGLGQQAVGGSYLNRKSS